MTGRLPERYTCKPRGCFIPIKVIVVTVVVVCWPPIVVMTYC